MEAQLFDGTILEFPDGTSPEVIQRVAREETAKRKAASAPEQGAAPEPPSALADVAQSLPSGVVRGAAETATLPVTLERAGQGGMDWLYRAIFGPDDPATLAKIDAARNGGRIGDQAQDAVRGVMNDTLHEPTTTAGDYAETIGEFLAPGGVPSKAARLAPTASRKIAEYGADLVRNAVTPAVISESAGQVAEGTPYETPARIAGAAVGNIGGALAKSYNAPETVLRRAAGDPNEIDWERAVGLQNNDTGVRLTGPEAITQAQGGASALPNLQRVVEGSVEGRSATAPFFAERPAQVDNAVNDVLDLIAPQSPNPSVLGPRGSDAAERAISASPEGQALADAIFGAGPRTTPMQAGEIIQPALRETFERREGMRNALADNAYEAARRASPTVPVDDLGVAKTVRKPGYTRLDPGENEITGQPEMQPKPVPAQIEAPSMTSRTGPDMIQVDARPVLKTIDTLMVNAKADTKAALTRARRMLHSEGGVDTSVGGIDSARNQIGDMITAAKQNGQMQQADRLLEVQRALDESLAQVPEYARANAVFKDASAPLEPFKSPGMGKTVARDEFNSSFTLPPESVPAALASPSEAKNFVSVASTDARAAAGNQLATQLIDKATEASGAVSGERLSALLRENQDLLGSYPEVATRLQKVVEAASNMGAARTGPLGKVAAANETSTAGNAILPQNPLTGSQDETADAVRRLLAEDTGTTNGLVRQNLADRYSKAATETQEGSREFAGAKFNKDVAGNTQRRATLDAVLGEANGGAAVAPMNELLDVLQATGRRKAIGSATEFNRALNADLGTASPTARVVNLAKTLGTSFITNAGDTVKRAALRNSLGELADMFMDPNSVEVIREAIARGPKNTIPEAALRSALQTQILAADQRGPR